MNEKQPPQSQGVIEEAARLFQGVHFSHTHGAYAEGRHVAVSVDPRWNEDEETFRVLISCTVLGHRRVDWARLPVQISPVGKGGMHALSRLDARGQTLVPRLPSGEYRLALRLKQAQAVPVLSHTVEKLAAQGEDDEHERRVWQGESEDGAITWSLEETEEGDVQIAFETKEERFAGHVLLFQLIDPTSKQTRYRRQLMLQPTRTPGKWEAWCSIGSYAEFPGPYELVFEMGVTEDTDS
jgi:hypothetical protein